jgi:hypothetical protein
MFPPNQRQGEAVNWIPWLATAGIGLLLATIVVWVWRKSSSLALARRQWELQRQTLQDLFFQAAASSGKPRGLRWTNCEWVGNFLLVREKATHQLAALASVLISFEAIPGSDMEEVEAVHNVRCASAVFFYHRGKWHTTGKALFNLDPDQAVDHLAQHYERLPT